MSPLVDGPGRTEGADGTTAARTERILVTGASGFVGRALCAALETKGFRVRGALRSRDGVVTSDNGAGLEFIEVGSIGATTNWGPALQNVRTIVHLAARTHQGNKQTSSSPPLYRQVNIDGTRRLAQTAAAEGVRRFVFISSVKVSGEATRFKPFNETDVPQPEDAYGISKWEAENLLRDIAVKRGMETVILRPPLVYGPGVKGNFRRLMRLISRQTPLPLASIANRRSLIYLGNLVDAIIACIDSPAAAGKTYLVSDGQDISTPDLIRELASALGVPARLFPCPESLLKVGAALLGKSAEIARLTGSLQVDSSKIQDELGWRPPFRFAQGLDATVCDYLNSIVSRP